MRAGSAWQWITPFQKVPVGHGGVPQEWAQDASNRVLSCTACNTFRNRYAPPNMERPVSLDEFYQLRDRIFVERKAQILERHNHERAFFESKPWLQPDQARIARRSRKTGSPG